MQAAQVVLDDLGQRPLDAGGGHVDQHIDAGEQLIDEGRIAQVAVADFLFRRDRRQCAPAARRPQAETQLEQGGPQHLADVPARA